MKDHIHDANMTRWDAGAERWAEDAESRGLWNRCAQKPELVLTELELIYLGDLSGKHVCVLGSGNNEVVFALAGQGANVTSVDYSQKQLDIAERRSGALGLTIAFIRGDVTDLACIPNARFDIVYTGGHVAVWVADLEKYYSEAARILRPNGLYIVNEYHPFRRIWKNSTESMVVESPYLKRGPFEGDLSDNILRPRPGPYRSYEFHWTVSDYLNAVLTAGMSLVFVDEYGDQVCDWEGAPVHGLPEYLLIIARKTTQHLVPPKT